MGSHSKEYTEYTDNLFIFLHLFIRNNKLIMLPIQKKTEFYFLKLMQYASVYTVYVLVWWKENMVLGAVFCKRFVEVWPNCNCFQAVV